MKSVCVFNEISFCIIYPNFTTYNASSSLEGICEWLAERVCEFHIMYDMFKLKFRLFKLNAAKSSSS